MTTMLQNTKRWVPALLLIFGLVLEASTVHAQSRGRTNGRQTKTENTQKKPTEKKATEKKATTSSRKTESSRSSSRSSSRQRATQPSNSSSNRSGSARTSSRNDNARSSSRSSGTQSSRQRATQSSRSTANRSSNAQSSRQRSQSSNRSSSPSSRQQSQNTRTTARDNSRGSSNQQNSGRSSRNTEGVTRMRLPDDNDASSRNSRSGSRSDAGSNRSSQSGNRSSANRGRTSNDDRSAGSSRQTNTGRSSSSRDRSTTRTTTRETTRTTTRNTNNTRTTREGSTGRRNTNNSQVNNGRRGSSGRGTVDARRNTGVYVDNSRRNARRDATGVRVLPARNYGWRNTRDHYVYKNRHWKYKNHRVYVNPVYHHRPHVQVNVVWPWQNRYQRQWRPSYRYCQVVYVESNYRGNYRRAKVDIRTNYHHEVRYADHRKAVVDIYLDEIEVFENGYYLGKVKRFPRDLEHIEATIYRNGDIVYDRDVFIVGDPQAGFELIATRSYDGYVMDHYDRSHGMEVGRLNFRRKRVDSRRYSKLFDPYGYNSYTPISVLPDDEQLLDFGYDAISYHHYDDNYDPYYGGSYDDPYYDYDNYGNHSVYEAPRGATHGRNNFSAELLVTQAQPLTLNRTQEFTTNRGVAVKLQREATLERLR